MTQRRAIVNNCGWQSRDIGAWVLGSVMEPPRQTWDHLSPTSFKEINLLHFKPQLVEFIFVPSSPKNS